MTNDEIDDALRKFAPGVAFEKQGREGSFRWEFSIGDTPAYVQTQGSVNRMRIVAEIGDPKHRERASLASLMEANFHSALDARYALYQNRLVAAFIHPLSELTREQFVSGLRQVMSCTLTSGRENSGGPLVFGTPTGAPSFASPDSSDQDLVAQLRKLGAQVEVNLYREPRPIKGRDIVVPLLAALLGALATLGAAILGG